MAVMKLFNRFYNPKALVEILLLSGGTPYANFRDLSHAWGREKGFHHLLASSVCERRGEVERKKRSDAGRVMTDAQRNAFKEKLNKSKLTRGDDSPRNGDCSDEEEDDERLLLSGSLPAPPPTP